MEDMESTIVRFWNRLEWPSNWRSKGAMDLWIHANEDLKEENPKGEDPKGKSRKKI